ncbi:protein translocase subunit SecF [Candidatus Peregrinibacteria bacterium]|jgi:SecD/SecF fusion protein|nr:protein translocase subunit SecF [Candidatus Peregrinibacteria bacterium]
MKKLLSTRIIPILVMALVLGFINMSQEKQTNLLPGLDLDQKVHLGLDLQGGTQLDYKIDLRKVDEADQEPIINGITEIINRRVNGLGVSEPNIYTSVIADEYHIIVELAGIKDIEEAKRTVGKTIQLEFKESVEELATEKKEEIRGIASTALQRIKNGETFTLVGNEEIQAYPGKVDFYDNNTFVSEEIIESDELKNTLKNLRDGDLYSGLIDTIDGFQVTNQGLQEKTGFYVVKRLEGKTETIEKEFKEEAEVSHIVIAHKESAETAFSITRTKPEALKLAREVRSKIESGEDFSALAKEYSDEPAAKTTGGKLIEPVRPMGAENSYYHPIFTAAALDLDTGELSEVVETPFGYHIIKSEEKTEAHTATVQETSYRYQALFYSTVPDGWKETGLTGEHFVRADVVADQFNNAMVAIKFNDEGRDLFGQLTEKNIGKPVAIFVGGDLISAPNVNEKILGGQAQISGNFTYEEASELARDLNTGAIPAPIVLSGQYSIGASLGADALSQSINAALIGIVLLVIYMVLYYRWIGVMANFALVVYALLLIFLIKISIPMGWSFIIGLIIYGVLVSKILKNEDSGWEKLISFFVASFVFFFLVFLLASPVVLTLAGIAGVILSIGMAVDANVLIFERIKEEVNLDRPMKHAIEVGFDRAWSSIRDSNYSSLITCAILLYFGTSIIKGFAINLAAGILVSMFTAITITRAFLDFLAESERGRAFLEWGLKRKKEPKILPIVKLSKVWFSFSGILITISIVAVALFGFNLGIDFTGGTMMEVQLGSTATSEDVTAVFGEVHKELVEDYQIAITNAPVDVDMEVDEVLDFSSPLILPSGENSFIIRTKNITNEQHDKLISALRNRFGSIEEPRFTVVGPVIGSVLKKKAFLALMFAGVMIVLYIAFAFRRVPKEVSPWRFGFCAIVALVHDVIITLGVFAFLGYFLNVEMDALFVTALLTIMGFSVHDTIVVFDRIRENLFLMKKNNSFDNIANAALNQTMARSLNTSISTLFTIAALFLLGAESVKFFVFALLIGIIVGTYSSIFTASPVLCAWRRWKEK